MLVMWPTPVLDMVDFSKQFIIEIDVSGIDIGAGLY